MTGRGGWPLTVFLTPDGEPFYGGTYFPAEPRSGLPGFEQVLRSVAEGWGNDRGFVLEGRVRFAGGGDGAAEVAPGTAEAAFESMRQGYDWEYGGFGPGQKFPLPSLLNFLLRYHVTRGSGEAGEMLDLWLRGMANGGVYDRLGGGFHRYSTDREWRVPHFEKMLYDSAQLVGVYARAHQVTGEEVFRDVAEETAGFLEREMRHPGGGFFAGLDADTEGEEGEYYTWTREELEEVVGEDGDLVADRYGVDDGDVERRSVLSVEESLEEVAESHGLSAGEAEEVLDDARERLFEAREDRPRPERDEKVLAGWNGLAVRGLAEASVALDDGDTLNLARDAAEFVLDRLWDGERLGRYWRDGEVRGEGFLEDHAFLGRGLLALYWADFDERWFTAATDLADAVLEEFEDPEGGFFDASESHGTPLKRPKSFDDTSTPSGSSSATRLMQDLGALRGKERYLDAAEAALPNAAARIGSSPAGYGGWLCAIDRNLRGAVEVAVVGERGDPGTEALLDVLREYRPDALTAHAEPREGSDVELLRDREPIGGKPTAYPCRRMTCMRPVTGPGELRDALEERD